MSPLARPKQRELKVESFLYANVGHTEEAWIAKANEDGSDTYSALIKKMY